MLVIRFRNPSGIDFPYLLSMLHDSFMSRPNTIVCPGRQDGAGDAAHLHADDLAASSTARSGRSDMHEGIDTMKAVAAPSEHAVDRPSRWRMRCACSRSMPSSRRNPAIPACRWAWPTSPSRCGAASAPQPGQSALARSRPLRAVERPRLDAALRAAAPDRLRPADRGAAATSASCIRRRRAIPKSASRPASRRPPARSARASPTRSAWRSPRSCSPREFNRPGHDDRRPPHLRLPRRRLPDGRHLARGLLARRRAGARQADRALRRQRHLDRRQGRGLVHRRHAEALRGLWLARDPRRRRPRRRRGRRGDRSRRKPIATGRR